jgi:L-fucose mutarotase
MLKTISPLLSPNLLFLLARMGHGDDLALVDANHPAEAISAATVSRTLVRMPGLRVDDVLGAILTLFPIDDFSSDPVRFMQPADSSDDPPAAVVAMQSVFRAGGFQGEYRLLERFAFYSAARASFGVVQCGETRLYGNVLIRKGVVRASQT